MMRICLKHHSCSGILNPLRGANAPPTARLILMSARPVAPSPNSKESCINTCYLSITFYRHVPYGQRLQKAKTSCCSTKLTQIYIFLSTDGTSDTFVNKYENIVFTCVLMCMCSAFLCLCLQPLPLYTQWRKNGNI